MPTIETRRRGDGTETYRVKIRQRGAPALSRSFDRKTDAKHWAQKIETEIREGRLLPIAAARRHTLSDAIERYQREVLPRKPRTATFQARQLDWWNRRLGHLPLAELTKSVIAAGRAALMDERSPGRRPRGPATANRYMAALSHVLSVTADEWEWLDVNNDARFAS